MNSIPCASPKPPAEVLRGKTCCGFCAAERRLPRRTQGKRRVKAARRICPVFREALAQEIQQGGIFFLLQRDLVQEFFSKKLLLLSR